jgi:hypothetical protein
LYSCFYLTDPHRRRAFKNLTKPPAQNLYIFNDFLFFFPQIFKESETEYSFIKFVFRIYDEISPKKRTLLLLLLSVSDWSIIIIRPGGLLLVVPAPICCTSFIGGDFQKKCITKIGCWKIILQSHILRTGGDALNIQRNGKKKLSYQNQNHNNNNNNNNSNNVMKKIQFYWGEICWLVSQMKGEYLAEYSHFIFLFFALIFFKKGDSNNIKSGRVLSANLACKLALATKRH